jgi:hypothetical protein
MHHTQDEDRLKKAVNSVPSHAELNAMLARSEEERVRFNRMDAEHDWPGFEGAPPHPPGKPLLLSLVLALNGPTQAHRPLCDGVLEACNILGLMMRGEVLHRGNPHGRKQIPTVHDYQLHHL